MVVIHLLWVVGITVWLGMILLFIHYHPSGEEPDGYEESLGD